jgi:hypothetical protein
MRFAFGADYPARYIAHILAKPVRAAAGAYAASEHTQATGRI